MMIILLMELPSDNIVWLQHIGISWESMYFQYNSQHVFVSSSWLHVCVKDLCWHVHTRSSIAHSSYSGLTAIATFLFTREVWNTRAGLFAAGFIAIVPGYISRSVAGSYDNEGIAIFALMFTYFLWIKSLKTGSVFWSTATSLSYFYMVNNAHYK